MEDNEREIMHDDDRKDLITYVKEAIGHTPLDILADKMQIILDLNHRFQYHAF